MSMVDQNKTVCTPLPMISGKCNVLGCRARVRSQCEHGRWCQKHETEHLQSFAEEAKPVVVTTAPPRVVFPAEWFDHRGNFKPEVLESIDSYELSYAEHAQQESEPKRPKEQPEKTLADFLFDEL